MRSVRENRERRDELQQEGARDRGSKEHSEPLDAGFKRVALDRASCGNRQQHILRHSLADLETAGIAGLGVEAALPQRLIRIVKGKELFHIFRFFHHSAS